jgi:hydrogenase maturation protein HypF
MSGSSTVDVKTVQPGPAVADAGSIGARSMVHPPPAAGLVPVASRLVLTGRVQGIGVRPALARLAGACELAGFVANRRDGVEVVIEGCSDRIAQFVERLPQVLPIAARLDSFRSEQTHPTGCVTFSIAPSADAGLLQTQVPTDLAVCSDCLEEVADPKNRRHDYPFTSCTNCGPRFSIVQGMPYERGGTSMARFELCPDCRREYTGRGDRRFHAQTNACPVCGPHIWACDRDGRTIAQRNDAIQTAVLALLDGKIVAIRGIGGYQLACDATNGSAVGRLRDRKRRLKKPLAVMVADLAGAESLAKLDSASQQALCGAENPIVLVSARRGGSLVAAIHPGLNAVGVMLPSTPLHWLLIGKCRRPLVMTSGNCEGEPLATEADEAEIQLREIADLWLHHNRPILHPVDDSVVRIIAGRPATLRLARGLAPLPLDLVTDRPAVSLGGHQKSAIAIANGAQAVLAPHIGDLDNVRSRERFASQLARMTDLYGASVELWLHDLHPDYFPTRWASEQPGTYQGVQHHHAHVAATMLEHGWIDRQVLGVAFDGTGFGLDGTTWGGEFLLATATEFRRVAHLLPFRLPGGEAAIREPWRVALSLLHEAFGKSHWPTAAMRLTTGREKKIMPLLENERFSPWTTSAGRLFDGVAAFVLEIDRADFEGAPAMLLEAAADESEAGSYSLPIITGADGHPRTIDWRPMIRELLTDLAHDLPRGAIAMRYHRALASAVTALSRRFAPLPVVLSGGVFQNRVLTELIAEGFSSSYQPLGLPGRIPPNDGGLAAGQLAIGLSRAMRKGAGS